MAIRSVAENSLEREPINKTSHIRGMEGLLIKVNKNTSLEELEHYISVSSDISDQILQGVEGVGELLWSSGSELNDCPVDSKTARTVGSLLKHLAEFSQALQELRSIARFQQLQHWKERCGNKKVASL